MENLENQNNKVLSDGALKLKSRLKVNKQNDLNGFFEVRNARVYGMTVENIFDKDGNKTGGYSIIKIGKSDCMDDLTFTGSEYLPELLVTFDVFYDFDFKIEKITESFKVAGANGRTFDKKVEITKFKLVSFFEHKN